MSKVKGFSYVFFWQGDLHVGVPLPNENSKLHIYAPDALEVEVSEPIIEDGKAVVPVRFHNETGGHHEVRMEFVEDE